MTTLLYARASAAGAALCTVTACSTAALDAGWIALGGLFTAALLAYSARRCYAQARRERAVEQRLKRLGQEQASVPERPPVCCSFWLHSDGEVHSPTECTRPRAARTTLTEPEEQEFTRLVDALRPPRSTA